MTKVHQVSQTGAVFKHILMKSTLAFNGHYSQKECTKRMYVTQNIHFIRNHKYCLKHFQSAQYLFKFI